MKSVKWILSAMLIVLATLVLSGLIDYSYSTIEDRDLDCLIIDKAKGIEGLCELGQSMEEVADRLGRPDVFEKGKTEFFSTEYKYEYHKYGILLVASGVPFETPKLFVIQIELSGDSSNRIRLYDEEKIGSPLTRDEVVRLYGEPHELQELNKWSNRLIYHFGGTKYIFIESKNSIERLIIM